MNKVLILPGSFSLVSAYGSYRGIDMWKRSGKSEKLEVDAKHNWNQNIANKIKEI